MTGTQTVLAIDTTGPRLQLALGVPGHVDVLVEELAKGHAEIVFGRIAQLLARNAETYAGLTRLAVTTGPGSFTGLRIGLSVARGLGLALGIPAIGVPTFQAMSLTVTASGPFAILRDARRDEAYLQLFTAPGLPEGPVQLLSNDAVAVELGGLASVSPESADIAALARFALAADPGAFPPLPAYIRDADAKPQTKGKIAHAGADAK